MDNVAKNNERRSGSSALAVAMALYNMAIGVVEFSREGYKIRKDFA